MIRLGFLLVGGVFVGAAEAVPPDMLGGWLKVILQLGALGIVGVLLLVVWPRQEKAHGKQIKDLVDAHKDQLAAIVARYKEAVDGVIESVEASQSRCRGKIDSWKQKDLQESAVMQELMREGKAATQQLRDTLVRIDAKLVRDARLAGQKAGG
jgi:hypothetical protein